jgi:hypothetical protein
MLGKHLNPSTDAESAVSRQITLQENCLHPQEKQFTEDFDHSSLNATERKFVSSSSRKKSELTTRI